MTGVTSFNSTGSTSASNVAAVVDSVTKSNVTFGEELTTATIAESGATTTRLTADQLTADGNFSYGTTSSSSNLFVVKNLTMKDSDAENSTELKSGVLINGTLVTLPPAVIAGYGSDDNQTSSLTGSDVTLTTQSGDSVVSYTHNLSAAYQPGNVSGPNRTRENATSTVDMNAGTDSIVTLDTESSVGVNKTASFVESEESSHYTVNPTHHSSESSVPALLSREVYHLLLISLSISYSFCYCSVYFIIFINLLRVQIFRHSIMV